MHRGIRDKIAAVTRLPLWLRGEESVCSAGEAGDAGSIPGSGRSPGERNGNPLQSSCLRNPMDRGSGGLQPTGLQKSDMT